MGLLASQVAPPLIRAPPSLHFSVAAIGFWTITSFLRFQAPRDLCRLFSHLLCSWSAKPWIPGPEWGVIIAGLEGTRGLQSARDHLHPRPSGWEEVMPPYPLVLVSLTSVDRGHHLWPQGHMWERAAELAASSCLSFSISRPPSMSACWAGMHVKWSGYPLHRFCLHLSVPQLPHLKTLVGLLWRLRDNAHKACRMVPVYC